MFSDLCGMKYLLLCFNIGVHGGIDYPPGQRGTGPSSWCCAAGGGELERGGGLRNQGADESLELPMGAPESGQHGEAEQVRSQKVLSWTFMLKCQHIWNGLPCDPVRINCNI